MAIICIAWGKPSSVSPLWAETEYKTSKIENYNVPFPKCLRSTDFIQFSINMPQNTQNINNAFKIVLTAEQNIYNVFLKIGSQFSAGLFKYLYTCVINVNTSFPFDYWTSIF